MSAENGTGTTLVNHWQRGVPVYRERVVTGAFVFWVALAVIGLTLALIRLFSPLGPFSGMNDAYAWGMWKTFNVMTLTALGSGPLAVGIAAWVFNRQKLHVVMRTALVSGFMFYAAGLIALGADVGRVWNFWNILLPWRWNTHSAMLEVAVCMPLYCALFLAYENLPMVLERVYYRGSDATRAKLQRAAPTLRRLYPFMLTGAYVLPLMHQSSLGGLLLLAGDKIHPVWQSPVLPVLYVLAAFVAGVGFVTFVLLITCLHYRRPIDLGVLGELGNLLSILCLVFLVVRLGDLAWRGQLGAAFAFDRIGALFIIELLLFLVPAIVLGSRRGRQIPRALVHMSALACLGGLWYRFVPTSIAFNPAPLATYFPATPEILMGIGYVALGVTGFTLAIKYFAVLPAESREWTHVFRK